MLNEWIKKECPELWAVLEMGSKQVSETKLYARLRVKTGEYSDGEKTKNRYSDIGVMFASEHFNNMFLQIETLPINKDWDGRIYVNPIEDRENTIVRDDTPMTQAQALNGGKDVVLEDIDDKPINLSEIPF